MDGTMTNCGTLQSKCRPFLAGAQVQTYWEMSPGNYYTHECTITHLNVTATGDTVMLTASHCTKWPFDLDDSKWVQSQFFNGDTVPRFAEWVDPPTFTGGQCPSNKFCRWSDASLAKLETGPTNGNLLYWGVMRTRGFPSLCCTIDVDQTTNYPWITVVGFQTVFSGQSVRKIGRTTGHTWGYVNATCQNREWSSNVNMLCQITAGMALDGGDSGSPLFTYSTSSGVGSFVGVIHSRYRDWQNKEHGVVSPFSNVKAEIPQFPYP